MSLVSIRQGEWSAAVNHSVRPGIPLSSYTPDDARSEIETRPISSESIKVSCGVARRGSDDLISKSPRSRFGIERFQLAKELAIFVRRKAAAALVPSFCDQS